MAASTYLLELGERREQLLTKLVDRLGIPSGSVEHEVALSFAASSLAQHERMDSEENKVETGICSFAEKFVMQGDIAKATRLLLLASSLSGKPMRVQGHRIVGSNTSSIRAPPPLEHPYGALALALALSGSKRWTAAMAVEAKGGQEEDGDLLGDFGGDSSRLWSTDSEHGEESEGQREQGRVEERSGSLSSTPPPLLEDVDEWLQTFEEGDDEGYATGESEVEHYDHRGEDDGARVVLPPALPSSSAAAPKAGIDNNDPGRRSVRPLVAGYFPFQRAIRHNYGAPCIGADIRSLGTHLGNGDGESATPVWSFLRPCQTLEACQTRGGTTAGRRHSVPEAEVVRAALHMLAGLSGDIFVRVDSSSSRDSGGKHRPDRDRHGYFGKTDDNDGGQIGGGGGKPGRWNDSDSNSGRQEWFSLSASAARDLAVASLSPEALAGVLENLVRVGSTAEYLRAFVADAEASTSVSAAGASLREIAIHGESDNSNNHSRRGGGSGGGSIGSGEERSPKHGHTTQAFVACVRRQLEAFEDTVSRRDRYLYRRQQGQGSNLDVRGNGVTAMGGNSGETIVGLLSLLRPEAESLELTRQLVEAGAGWWVATPSPGEERAGRRRRRTGDTRLEESRGGGGSGAGLRERTGRLLSVLHDAVVSSSLVGVGRQEKKRGIVEGDRDALAPRRHGWLLRVFCEVLEPYLRLLDTWITDGRLLDPHRELFFSQIGRGVFGGDDAHSVGIGGNARGPRDSDDPVVHVWDTGIVLHSKALPPFLASLASAVALAGQDVSLTRRVRHLVNGSSSSVSACSRTNSFSLSNRVGPPPSGRTGTEKTVSMEQESFSLAKTLVESLQRLARRVRRANDAGLTRKGKGHGGERRDRDHNLADDATAAVSTLCGSGLDRIDLEEGGSRKDVNSISPESVEGASPSAWASMVEGDTAAKEVEVEAGAAEKRKGKRATSGVPAVTPGGGDVTDGDNDIGDGDVGGVGDRRSDSGSVDGGTGGGGPVTQPEVIAEDALASGGGGGAAAAAAEEEKYDLELGFFGGTMQLALKPGAMFERALHPAIAPPSLPLPPSARGPTPAVAGQRTGGGSEDAHGATRRATKGDCALSFGGDGVDDYGEDDKAGMDDDVARALPPAVVLETCLLRPLRDHCRLASSTCLSVFVDELGIIGLAGVLRETYLCPGGAKSDSPLSRFRGVLFSLLGALAPPALAAGAGSSSPALLDGLVVRDVTAFLQDGARLTALLESSLAVSGLESGAGNEECAAFGRAGGAGGPGEGGQDGGACLRSPVSGSDRPLLEHFFVKCRPEVVREWREGEELWRQGGQPVGDGSGTRGAATSASAATAAFPFVRDGRCVDLRVFSCLQLECRLPWPISVALPPRSMDKYSRTLGLLLKLEFTNHVLEEAHVLHSHAQRSRPRSGGGLDRRHLHHCRLFAFLRVARAVRSYAVTQVLVEPWVAFETRLPLCGSVRSFIRLHEAYLDLILERCFLLPRSRQTLAYLLDALQAGIAFSQRYGEYVTQLDTFTNRSGSNHPISATPAPGEEDKEESEACRESLRKLDELWESLVSALGFVIPVLKEMVRSRSAVHVNDLLTELDFSRFFERQEAWRTERRTAAPTS